MKRIAIQMVFMLSVMPLFAQTERVDSLLLSVMGNDKAINRLLDPPSLYLYSSLTCDNKTFYAGRELGDNMYAINGNIYLMHSAGFYAGIAGSAYSELDPSYNATVVTVGFLKPVNRKRNLTVRASYNHYFFNQADTSGSPLTNILGAGLSLRGKHIGGRVYSNFFFGDGYGMNASADLFMNITLLRFGTTGRLAFVPEASLFYGSEAIEYSTTGVVDSQTVTEYSTEEKYGFLNTTLTLPLSVYAGDFDFEVSYSINLPNSMDNTISYPAKSFFSLTIGYLLPLN